MSKVKRKQSGGESMDDCWSKGLNGFKRADMYCPIAKGSCKVQNCVFYSAEVDGGSAEYDNNGFVKLVGVEPGGPEYDEKYQKSVTHRCLVLEILEGLHWLIGRWDDNGDGIDDGLKSLVADMADRKWSVDTYEQNTTRYVVTE